MRKFLCLILLCLATLPINAQGLFTEIGLGIKIQGTSRALKPSCSVLYDSNGELYSCGGDNPIFIGWPLAWEFPRGQRFGWFHMSHWADGRNNPQFLQDMGDGREIAFNCLCYTHKFEWFKRN